MMKTIVKYPTIEDVNQIINNKDPVIRNLQITQCYYELSRILSNYTGLSANWCTFATWASKQAGQTIRKEDLARLLERRINQSPSTVQATKDVVAAMNIQGGPLPTSTEYLAMTAPSLTSALDRTSDAVSRGNLKVFREIGYEFARFFQTCFHNQQVDHEAVIRFCQQLRPGDPPGGQDTLRHAFLLYSQAIIEKNSKTRAELILMANLAIGFHEQTRLQPEIAESMDAGFWSLFEFTRPFVKRIFPMNGWFHLAYLYLRRLIGRPTDLDLAIQTLLAEVRKHLRHIITETMMTISLPSGVVLRLGRDLQASFPDSLRQITNPDLIRLLEKYDLTLNSLRDTGAMDWADLPDRLHFILDLFRCYQEKQDLFEPPFSLEQADYLRRGRLPLGRL